MAETGTGSGSDAKAARVEPGRRRRPDFQTAISLNASYHLVMSLSEARALQLISDPDWIHVAAEIVGLESIPEPMT